MNSQNNITVSDSRIMSPLNEAMETEIEGKRVWETDWFDIGVSTAFDFEHNLNIAEPWKCLPMLVGRTKNAIAGWQAGEILFGDGSNYNGATSSAEYGWIISISESHIHMSIGNGGVFVHNAKNGGFGTVGINNLEYKLVMYY